MNFRSFLSSVAILAALVVTSCGDKPTDPSNAPMNGSGSEKAAITTIIGQYSVTDAQCYFLKDSNKNEYELSFANIKRPELPNGTLVKVSGFLSAGNIADLKCDFKGPEIEVLSITAIGIAAPGPGTITSGK